MDPVGGRRERLVEAVIPTPLQRPVPVVPHPVPELPAPGLPVVSPQGLLLGMARLDGSGRVHERTLLAALGWRPGQRIEVATVHAAIIARAAPTGLHIIGGRGELTLPAAARALCGITPGSLVVLAAAVAKDVLIVHPPLTVAGLLCAHYAHLDGDHAD